MLHFVQHDMAFTDVFIQHDMAFTDVFIESP